jgi:DNA polymerase I-like protein with 3'-5' exonuclease and polymerase domains
MEDAKKAQTGRSPQSRGREPSIQNVPLSTAQGRAIRGAFFPKSVISSFDFAEIEHRTLKAASTKA